MQKTLYEIYERNIKVIGCVFCDADEVKLYAINEEKDQPVCMDCLKTETEEYEEPPTSWELLAEANR